MLFEKIELEPNEIVLTTVRKHWFIITAELLGIVMLVILPIFIFFALLFLRELMNLTFTLDPYLPLLSFAACAWMLFCVLTAFTIWTHFFLDLWVITDRRIIVIDQINFFNRKISSFRLERLQDIKVAIDGIIPTFLNFGTLRAQTASAAESNFISTGLPDPRGIQSIIQKATDARLESLRGAITETLIS